MRRCHIILAALVAVLVAGPVFAGMVPSVPSGQQSSWLNGPGPIRDTGFLPEFGYGPMFSSGGTVTGSSGGSGGGGGQGGDGSGGLATDGSQKDRSPFAFLPEGLFVSPPGASLGTGAVPGGFVSSIPSEPAPVQSALVLNNALPLAPTSPLLPDAVSPTALASPYSQNPLGQGGLNADNGIGTDSNSLQLPGDAPGMTPPLSESSLVSGPVNTLGGDAPDIGGISPIQPTSSGPGAGFGGGSGGLNAGSSIQPNIAAVPEPASLTLCCIGVAGALASGLRRRFANP
ncbi:MAG: PEP-CTERM sorting domain-containing protein [Gemmataceae bacterium]